MQMTQILVETKLTRHCPESLKEDHWIDALSDRTRVLIRPTRAEDRQLERDFIMGLSPESRRFRFCGTFKQPSDALLNQLMDAGDAQKVAFIAVIHEEGHLREIGASRFASEPDGRQCEFAITVADDWNQRGLGATLMKHLIGVARDKRFCAAVFHRQRRQPAHARSGETSWLYPPGRSGRCDHGQVRT
jgi:GNAT superfamily N-acetyltransferase